MARRARDLSALETRIGYCFADRTLLDHALTHMSAVSNHRTRIDSYQRLEFLGDRVLGLCIAECLVLAYPLAEEGELSRRLAELVRRETCADVATDWGVELFIRVGAGEAHSGARRNRAILADACEAIIGAAFLDGGLAASQAIVAQAFGDRVSAPRRPLRDAKTVLQEWVQAKGLPTPEYAIVERSGPDHAPHFIIGVSVETLERAIGKGRSRRDAEQDAASAMLAREGVPIERIMPTHQPDALGLPQERTAQKRTAQERTASERTASEQTAQERTAQERTA